MKRRDFIMLLGGVLARSPAAAEAQPQERIRRVAVLDSLAHEDDDGQARHAAFAQTLERLGWIEGKNLRIDARRPTGTLGRAAADLVALSPDVVFAVGSFSAMSLSLMPASIPTVIAMLPDPTDADILGRFGVPGANAYQFLLFDYGVGIKLVELLKEAAPGLKRAMVLHDRTLCAAGLFPVIQSAAHRRGVDVTGVSVHDPSDIEREVTAFAHESNSGLIVTDDPWTTVNRQLLVSLAARNKLPAICVSRAFAKDGGLISYGPDFVNQYRRGAAYVDRILKGDRPADLPRETQTKVELVINLKTAKALGLTVPQMLLATADDVIQ